MKIKFLFLILFFLILIVFLGRAFLDQTSKSKIVGSSVYNYTPKARGDFNGDGWEEILFFHSYHGTDHTFVNFSYACLNLSGEQASLALTDCGEAAE